MSFKPKRVKNPHDRVALPTCGCVQPAKRNDSLRSPLEKAHARSLLTELTLRMLLHEPEPPRCNEEIRLFDAQLCEPVEFLRDVADHLCLTPRGVFTEDAIQQSIESVAGAYDQLIAEQPAVAQRAFSWRAWHRDGTWIQ